MPFSDRVEAAFSLAAKLHRNQDRKGTAVPYLAHLMAVAALVAEAGGSEDEVIAALLHDAVEDQGGMPTLELIRRQFGDAAADIVAGCSDSFVDTRTAGKEPWQQRKDRYLAHLREAPPSVQLVSAADKLHNARSVVADLREQGEATWDRFTAGRKSLWFYREVVRALAGSSAPQRLVAELERTVRQMHELAGEDYGRSDAGM